MSDESNIDFDANMRYDRKERLCRIKGLRGMDMVDEKKTILMTKLAIFEKHEDNKSLVVSKYYRSDYVRYNVLKTWVAITILYWCLIAGYVFMEFDSILSQLNDLDYFAIVYKMLGGYAVVCLIYFVFSYLLYNYRYQKAKKGLVDYNVNLKKLIHADDEPAAPKRALDANRRTTDDMSSVRTSATPQQKRANVSRSAMVQRQLEAEQERKNQEIIENVKKRNERVSAKQEEELRRQRQIEEERRRIRERRERLEREQLEKLRQERMQQGMYRENHEYNANRPNGSGRGDK